MQNLAHSASFESLDKGAPSKAEIKHLVPRGTADIRNRTPLNSHRPFFDRIRKAVEAARPSAIARDSATAVLQAVQYLQLAARLKRDDDAVGRQIDLVEFDR
jgi:hypothetical protein